MGWRDDRQALLDIADICALPSRYESFGTVMAESWFMRTPLVAAKAQGPSQYIVHEENGLLCDIDDSQGLADQIRRLSEDQSLRQTLIKNGLQTYNDLFNKDVVIDSFIDTYKTILTF